MASPSVSKGFSFIPISSASFLLRVRQPFLCCALAFTDLFESRTFVHGHVVSLVALDQILRLLLRSANGVRLKLYGGGDLLLDCSADPACFRVPLNIIPNFE